MRHLWILALGVTCIVAIGATVLVTHLLRAADEGKAPIAAPRPVLAAAPVAAVPVAPAPIAAAPPPALPAAPPAFIGIDPRAAQRQVAELERELAFFQADFSKVTRTYREEALKALASIPAPVMMPKTPSRLGAMLAVPGRTLLDHVAVPPGQGLVVVKLTPGGPAERAGLQPSDILLEMDGQFVPRDLVRFKTRCDAIPAKRAVDLVVLRKGKHHDIKGLVLAEAPAPVAIAAPPARGPAACVK